VYASLSRHVLLLGGQSSERCQAVAAGQASEKGRSWTDMEGILSNTINRSGMFRTMIDDINSMSSEVAPQVDSLWTTASFCSECAQAVFQNKALQLRFRRLLDIPRLLLHIFQWFIEVKSSVLPCTHAASHKQSLALAILSALRCSSLPFYISVASDFALRHVACACAAPNVQFREVLAAPKLFGSLHHDIAPCGLTKCVRLHAFLFCNSAGFSPFQVSAGFNIIFK
jgi:hypothetical protein